MNNFIKFSFLGRIGLVSTLVFGSVQASLGEQVKGLRLFEVSAVTAPSGRPGDGYIGRSIQEQRAPIEFSEVVKIHLLAAADQSIKSCTQFHDPRKPVKGLVFSQKCVEEKAFIQKIADKPELGLSTDSALISVMILYSACLSAENRRYTEPRCFQLRDALAQMNFRQKTGVGIEESALKMSVCLSNRECAESLFK